MSLLAQAKIDALSPEELWATNADTPSTFSDYLGLSYGQGVEGNLRGVTGAVGPDYQPPMSGGIFGEPAVQQPSGTPRLTEEQWKASKNYRPEIPYDPGMTEARAEFLKQQFDSRRWRDDVYRRYQGGLAGQAAGIAAMLAGGALSPENFIPILGPASRAYMAARLGKVGAYTAAGAIEGAVGNLAVAPYVYQGLAAQGEDVGLEDVALDVAFGAIIGGAFGAGAGGLARARAMREAAVSGRGASVHTATDALNLAADAVERGDVPDVGRVVAPEVERARAVVDRLPPVEAVTPESAGRVVAGEPVAPVAGDAAPSRPVAEAVPAADMGIPMTAEPVGEVAGTRPTEPAGRMADAGQAQSEAGAFTVPKQQPHPDSYDGGLRVGGKDFYGERHADAAAAAMLDPAVGPDVESRWRAVEAAMDDPANILYRDRQTGNVWTDADMGAAPTPSFEAATGGQGAVRQGGAEPAGVAPSAKPAAIDARPIPPDPEPESVTTAAARVGKDTPELQQFAEDMGLEDSSVVDMDLNELRRSGALTEADEAALKAADEETKMAESVALSYETLSTCVLRYGT